MSGSTLATVRTELHDLLDAALPANVTLGWGAPVTAQHTEGETGARLAAWMPADGILADTERLMTRGWVETYELEVIVQALPPTGSTSIADAEAAAGELLDAVVETVEANQKTITLTGWTILMLFAGYEYRAGTVGDPPVQPGNAARYTIRIGVEATRC